MSVGPSRIVSDNSRFTELELSWQLTRPRTARLSIIRKGDYSSFVISKNSLIGIDRWAFMPGLVSLVTVAAISLVCQLPGIFSFLMIPISLLGYAVGSIIVLGTTVFLLIKKRPRTGASILLIFLLPLTLWSPINRVADLIHLVLTAGLGVGQLGTSSTSGDSEFFVYDWSVGLAGGPNRFLIHDVTDEIARPMAKHTNPSSSENGFGEECAGRVDRLVSHYYVCTF